MSQTSTTETTQCPNATAMCTGVINSKTSNLNVLLATAVVNVSDKFGFMHSCRAVLYSVSQLNFVTHSFAKKLNLCTSEDACSIVGVSSMSSTAKQLEDTIMCSRFRDYKINIKLHTVPVIVNSLPSQLVNRQDLKIPSNVQNLLADPQFHVPGPVDLLLGADIFFEIFSGERHALSEHAALNYTKLGWIVTGKVPAESNRNISTLIVNKNSALSFFVSKGNQRSLEELQAEEHFKANFSRNEYGRFVIRLPLFQDPQVLGDSLFMACKRFHNLERRLSKDNLLTRQYDEFIQEYITMGHMEPASPVKDETTYYLPHHAVIKTDSATIKLRVVFDGSAEAKSGVSLNNIMVRGPKIQKDIFNILLRFRLHRVALTADIEKMYRQVLVAPEDCNLPRIVYRLHPNEQLQEYRLKTITYGTKSASFLATRCLSELGYQHHPSSISTVICQDFYVDDLLSGSDNEEDCYLIFEELHSILGAACFPLRKWCSNSMSLLHRLPHVQEDPNFMVNLSNENDVVSALGLWWQPSIDSFRFTMKNWIPPISMTKRNILSDINSVYDPIGLITPVLIKGKVFIQQIWSQKMSWDAVLSDELRSKWIKFYSSLTFLNELVVPRLLATTSADHWELHRFCDASQHAFGACVYLRCGVHHGDADIKLYASRSRVSPLKATTIPRLELCGALLAELIAEIKEEFKKLNIKLPSCNIHLWTDSTIVFA